MGITHVLRCHCSLSRKHRTFVIQSPSPRRRRCSKSSSCSVVASNPPQHTSTLTSVIVIAIVQWPKYRRGRDDLFCFAPFLEMGKPTQVSTQHLQCSATLCITLCLQSFPPGRLPNPVHCIELQTFTLHINSHAALYKTTPAKRGCVKLPLVHQRCWIIHQHCHNYHHRLACSLLFSISSGKSKAFLLSRDPPAPDSLIYGKTIPSPTFGENV